MGLDSRKGQKNFHSKFGFNLAFPIIARRSDREPCGLGSRWLRGCISHLAHHPEKKKEFPGTGGPRSTLELRGVERGKLQPSLEGPRPAVENRDTANGQIRSTRMRVYSTFGHRNVRDPPSPCLEVILATGLPLVALFIITAFQYSSGRCSGGQDSLNFASASPVRLGLILRELSLVRHMFQYHAHIGTYRDSVTRAGRARNA